MSNSIPHSLSDRTLTFYVNGVPHQVLRDHPRWDEIVTAVNAGDPIAVELAKPVIAVQTALDESSEDLAKYFRRSAVAVEVSEWGVKVDGNQIHGHLVDRLLDVLKTGLSIDPWVRFVGKLYQNPSSTARNELYLWLEKGKLPITPDGDFLAFKNVRADFKDIHSGTFDNSVGQVVSMNRLDVDDDRNRTCSAGLHFCSKDYLPHFSQGGHTMVVKVNPADVVSIPSDYDNAKGRTWRYEVVGEIEENLASVVGPSPWSAPVVPSYDGRDFTIDDEDDDEDDYDYDSDEEYDGDDTDEDDDADRNLIGKVFGAYAAKYNVISKDEPQRSVRLYRAGTIIERVITTFGDLTVGEANKLIAAWS